MLGGKDAIFMVGVGCFVLSIELELGLSTFPGLSGLFSAFYRDRHTFPERLHKEISAEKRSPTTF